MLRVVKVGGSLLGWSEARNRLTRWLQLQPVAKTVVIAGGGRLVDEVRQWHETFDLDPKISHRLALDCMSLTHELLSNWFDFGEKLGRMGAIQGTASPLILLDTKEWVLSQTNLPESWELTSDSISAAVAAELGADELVLLKSCLPSDSAVDYYDPLFSRFVATSKVRVVSLKSKDFDEVPYS